LSFSLPGWKSLVRAGSFPAPTKRRTRLDQIDILREIFLVAPLEKRERAGAEAPARP